MFSSADFASPPAGASLSAYAASLEPGGAAPFEAPRMSSLGSRASASAGGSAGLSAALLGSALGSKSTPTTPETRSPAMIQPVRTVISGVEQTEDAVAMTPGDAKSVHSAQKAFEKSVRSALKTSAVKPPPGSARSLIEHATSAVQESARAAGVSEEIVPLSVTVAVESSADASAIAAVLAPPMSIERLTGSIPESSAPRASVRSAMRSAQRGSAQAAAELSAKAASAPVPGTLVYTATPAPEINPDMDGPRVIEDYLNTILDVATNVGIVKPDQQERIIFAVAHAFVIYAQNPNLFGASLPILHFLHAPMAPDDARVASRGKHSVFVAHLMQLFNIDQESAEQFAVSWTVKSPFVMTTGDLHLLKNLLTEGGLCVRKAACILAKQQEDSNQLIGRIYNAPRLAKVDFMYRLRLVDEDVLEPAAAAVAAYLYNDDGLAALQEEIAGFVEIFRTIETSADPLGPGLLVAQPPAA